MAPDFSNLQLVDEIIETVDDSQYRDATEFPPPPSEGMYTFSQGKPEFAASKDGFLTATMNHTIVGGEADGQKVMFDTISEKPINPEYRGGVRGCSSLKDQLRAVYPPNTAERSARTRAEQAQALEAAEGKTFKGKIRWEGYCVHKGTEHEGKDAQNVRWAKNFPNGSDVPCPTCGSAIRPRARINLRVSAQ